MTRHGPDDLPQRGADGRLDEEVRFHLDQQVEALVRQGRTRLEAEREARLRFGGVEAAKDAARDERRGAVVRGLGRDLRMGARALGRAPGFAALAMLTLGLGIGASTALFSVVEGVLLRELPYPEADRIVWLHPLNVSAPDAPVRPSSSVAEPNVVDWRDRAHGFEAIALMSRTSAVSVVVGGQAVMARTTQVSDEFFTVMGATPTVGRGFAPDERREGGPPVALVSAAFRERVFGEALPTDASIRFGTTAAAVIGEMPDGFDFPGGTEVWLPEEAGSPSTSRTAGNHRAIARLAPGVTLEAAQGDLSAVTRAMKQAYGDETWTVDVELVRLLEQTTASVRPAITLLFAAAAVLFVIACTNVTNLVLARDAARGPEVALQLALGAGRWRLVRQRVVEAFVLCAAGAGAGLVVARLAIQGLVALDPGSVPRLQGVGLNWSVLGFACAVTLVGTVGIGLVAALRSADHDVRAILAEAARSMTGGRGRERAREALVVTQVALSLVLLVGTALLSRSFVEVTAVDPGFRTDDAVAMHLVMPWPATPDVEVRQWQLQERFMTEMARLPGVEHVGLASGAPSGGGSYASGRYLEMTSVDEIASMDDVAALGERVYERAGNAGFRVVSGGYFDAMGIPVLAGRTFGPADLPDAPHVAVVSQSLAEERWAGRDPIGRFLQFGNMDGDLRGFRVVGVVGDVRELTPEAEPGPLVYVDHRQRPRQGSRATIVVAGGTEEIGVTAQRLLRSLDPDLPLRVEPVADAFDAALRGRRFNLLLVTAFGAAALALAVLGTYGLISFLVRQRTREIGIRLALGAAPGSVIRLVAGRGARLAGLGVALGLGVAWLLTGLVAGLLYGVSPTDPASLATVTAVTVAAVVAASLVPAWRASRISPTETLRS